MELSASEQRLLTGVQKNQPRGFRVFVVVVLLTMIACFWGMGGWCAWTAHHFYDKHMQAAEDYLTAAATRPTSNASFPPGCAGLLGMAGLMGVAVMAFLWGLWFVFYLLIDLPRLWRRERLLLRFAERLRELGELEELPGDGT
ncbi:MAG TPA: hypothetical protein VNA25_11960 [Phycisphaerae bacterium]|nr:hypothetical protein [Phycisphaerae bacterium]